jgi:hypothetical protein
MTAATVPFRPPTPSGGQYIIKYLKLLHRREAWLTPSAVVNYFRLSGDAALSVQRGLNKPAMFSRFVVLSTQTINGAKTYLVRRV